MVRNRVISFPRQIIVCLSLSLIIFLFALSCQKDEGTKQNDPNSLTLQQAKEYFESNTETLQFLKFLPCSPSTKSQDSLNASSILISNMVIDWDNTFIGETSDQYYAEIPIKMISPLSAIIYDGIGHYNKNIHKVGVNVSMLIMQNKATGLLEHREVIGVGSFSVSNSNSIYPYSSDKSGFNGYLIFCNESGEYLNSIVFSQGISRSSQLYNGNFAKVDSLGRDIHFRGISFMINKGVLTKGGGGSSSGEDNICPICNAHNTISYINGMYYCSACMSYFMSAVDFICPDCSYPFTNCQCICLKCGFVKSQCKCLPEEGEEENLCPYCYTPGCTGQCQSGNGNFNNGYSISVSCDSLKGYVSINPLGDTYQYNTNVTLTAHPYSGYVFTGWYESGSLVSTNNPYTICVQRNYSLTGVFSSN